MGPGNAMPQRRKSFSQANLDVRHEGPQGELLARALTVPEADGYTLTHGFHPYPGRFHRQLPAALLRVVAEPGQSLLDPFMGGGTTLVEAMLQGLVVTGNDLNPVATVVARERTRPRTQPQAERVVRTVRDIGAEVTALRRSPKPPRVNHPRLAQLAPHYQPHLFAELVQWARLIDEVRDSSVRETLRAVLSAGVVKFSNRRSDSAAQEAPKTFPKGAAGRFLQAKAEELVQAQVEFARLLPEGCPRPKLFAEDARLLPSLPWAQFDHILTSPPYPGTYDYAEQHQLRMDWLCLDSGPFLAWEIGARREGQPDSWSAANRDVMVALARVIKPGGNLYLVIGDWLEDGHPVDGGAMFRRIGRDKGWRLVSSAAVQREAFSHKERRAYAKHGKWEHLLHFTRGEARSQPAEG